MFHLKYWTLKCGNLENVQRVTFMRICANSAAYLHIFFSYSAFLYKKFSHIFGLILINNLCPMFWMVALNLVDCLASRFNPFVPLKFELNAQLFNVLYTRLKLLILYFSGIWFGLSLLGSNRVPKSKGDFAFLRDNKKLANMYTLHVVYMICIKYYT